MKIVIVEDEKIIRDELDMLLRNSLYETTVIEQFTHTVEQIRLADPDLVLLDLHLPGQDGHTICKELRASTDIPVIVLTSQNDTITEVNSMLLGADDFIAKPYHPSVLLARISAVLKRSVQNSSPETASITYRGITLDLRSYKVRFENKEIELSKNEFKLLHYLFMRQEEIIPRLDIIEYLWDNDVFIDDNALSVTMTRIRNKLGQIGVRDLIETKRGLGYKI